jgi:hypothetical protein
MKTKSFFNRSLVSMLTAGTVCFAACTDDNLDSLTESTAIGENTTDHTIQQQDEVEPTIDLMSVKVKHSLPTAAIGTFDSNSTGAALLNRLSKVSGSINDDTRFVLLKGSEMPATGDTETWKSIYRVYKQGGFIGVETPTTADLNEFSTAMIEAGIKVNAEELQQQFSLTEAQATESARQSGFIDVMNNRIHNIEAVSGAAIDADAEVAEMIIFGQGGYFLSEPLETEKTALQYSEDQDGNRTEPEAVNVTCERNEYRSGLEADGAAQWFNEMLGERQDKSVANGMTRGGVQDYIDADELGERFTYRGTIDYRHWNNSLRHRTERVVMNIRTCGVHNVNTNKDYYYVKQDVTLSMGNQAGWKVYLCEGFDNNKTDGMHKWWEAYNFGDYDCYYGAMLSRYYTSMNLTGKGDIHLEAATPATDNYTVSTSISVGSSSETTEELGISWGSELGLDGPKASLGGSWSRGTTKGSSFEMGHSTEKKQLSVAKRTSGTKAEWEYKGQLPTCYSNGSYFCHTTTPDILKYDADLNNEACWSVANPSGQYKLDIDSYPETAVMLLSLKNSGHNNPCWKYEYTGTNSGNNASFTLREPSRARQSWRMNIIIDEWENGRQSGAVGEMEDYLHDHFSDVYTPKLIVFDKTKESLDVISSFIKCTKQVFDKNYSVMEDLARNNGVKQYTILWTCDTEGVTLQDSYTVYQFPKATAANSSYVGWIYGSNGHLYPNVNVAQAHGQTALGILAYMNDGSEFGNAATEKASGAGHGLVIALRDAMSANDTDARISLENTQMFPIASGTGYTQYVNKETGMAAALKDFDGLAKTKHLSQQGSEATQQLANYSPAAPANTTGWFIPATGQWIAIFCTPGLGEANMPEPSGDFFQKFNITPTTKISEKLREQGGERLENKIWTSSAYNGTTGIYFDNNEDVKNFSWWNWKLYAWVRPVFAF